LVYLPFENQNTVTEWLQQRPDILFKQYSPDVDNSTAGNVQRRTTDDAGFKYDLSTCRGVLCNSGFEVISECLQWGKPVLTFPMRGQMEQLSNALALDQLNLAMVSDTLDSEALSRFLDNLREHCSINYPNVAQALALWIRDGANKPPSEVARGLWRGVRIPSIASIHTQQTRVLA